MSNLEERQALIGEMAEHLKKNIYHSEERKITTPRKEYQAESQKVVSLEEAIRRSGLKDGMTISFHHHFRGGDKVLNMVMDKIAEMGIKDLHVAASSLNDVHKPLIEHIKNGVVTRISTSGMRGELAKAISHGILKEPVVFRSHGGRGSAMPMATSISTWPSSALLPATRWATPAVSPVPRMPRASAAPWATPFPTPAMPTTW